MVAFGFCINLVPINGWDTKKCVTCIWMRQASPCSWQCQKNNLIYALKYKSRSYTTWWYIMVASMWGWIQYWSSTLDPCILMGCYIFMTDGVLDLEWYIAVWTCWLRVRVYVVQVWCINHKGILKHYWGFWSVSPTQPKNHKGHNLFRSLEWTHQFAGVRWHPGSSTKYYAKQTLYESQRCDDGVEVGHVRNNHPKRH